MSAQKPTRIITAFNFKEPNTTLAMIAANFLTNSSMLSDMMQIVFRGVEPFLSSNKSATTTLTATFGVRFKQNGGTKIVSLHKQLKILANTKSIRLSLLYELSIDSCRYAFIVYKSTTNSKSKLKEQKIISNNLDA